MKKGSLTSAVWCLALFLLWEIIAAALLAFYIIYPCFWPLSQRDACLPPKVEVLCPTTPCIRKCCPLGEELFKKPSQPSVCRPTDNSSFSLDFVPLLGNDSLVGNYTHYTIFSMGLCPHGMFKLDPSLENDRHVILANGSLLLIQTRAQLPPNMFCIDSYPGHPTTVFQCFSPPKVDGISKIQQEVFSLTLTVSVPFLIATAAIYILLPKLRTLHGHCMLCYVFSQIIGTSVLAVVQMNIYNLNTDYPRICATTAFVIQFSFLATFFWLNVMCFDIWWVFSGLKPLKGSVKEREHKKFILYSLYAWGCPLIILGVSLFMELAPDTLIPASFIKPQFGIDKCWFKDANALILYFYLPIGVLILLNIVMFVTTAFHLHAHRKSTRKYLKGSESRQTSDDSERQRFNLYLKLFIVMGINWVMELISYFVGGPKYIWFLTDIGNTLQGLLIFIIFVCKRRILHMLNKKLCPKWNLVGPTSTSDRSKVSTTRSSSLTVSKTTSNSSERVPLKQLGKTDSVASDTTIA